MGRFEISAKDFTILNKESGNQIYGRLYCPVEDGTFPAVIISHGFNGSCADFTQECTFFAENGYVAFSYDFCGGSTGSKSDGKTEEMTIFTEKSDLMAVFSSISGLDVVNSGRIFLMGGSQGGLVTALAAEELGEKVRAAALYYPAFNIPDDWRKNYKETSDIPEITELWGMKLGKIFFTAIRDFYTFDVLGGYGGDVLIIYGSEDPIVPSGAMERAERAYENAEIIVLPGEGHGFSPVGAEMSKKKVLEFMQERM